ncbi:OmpH family outer membrane protein [Myroides albus]|uniref:OmpH family outer membrane protein n=1 Tax=Myroides albus TaxID=2562892 RepID=A0A6I3LPG4_9FLAO|nr:OmpH family outer membrane protein [Myroides albus]MTG97865.1 OmpH family outer membrane protein [Myroides albus]UVD81052.1 OmpH family outer membrane protein [Myroides albus]
MKKSLLVLGLATMLFSCNNSTSNEFKTGYVDSAKLFKEYEEVKDVESKLKIKADEKGKAFDGEVASFQKEAEGFQRTAAQKGQAWAEQKAKELQRREQELQFKQNTLIQELQKEQGEQMDLVVKKVKEYIAEYAKKNNFEYVFNTDDASTIIYSKDGNDITDIILKELNAKYKGDSAVAKTDIAPTEATPEKK